MKGTVALYRWGAMGLIVLTTLCSPRLHAGTVTTVLDWSGASFDLLAGGSANYSVINTFSEVRSDGPTANDSADAADWSTPLGALVMESLQDYARASADGNGISAEVAALSSAGSYQAFTLRRSEISTWGAGMLVVSVPFHVSVDVNSAAGEWAKSAATLVASSGNPATFYGSFATIDSSLNGDAVDQQGWLSVALPVFGGSPGAPLVYAVASTVQADLTAVPLPAAAWLMLSGLLGVAGFSMMESIRRPGRWVSVRRFHTVALTCRLAVR